MHPVGCRRGRPTTRSARCRPGGTSDLFSAMEKDALEYAEKMTITGEKVTDELWGRLRGTSQRPSRRADRRRGARELPQQVQRAARRGGAGVLCDQVVRRCVWPRRPDRARWRAAGCSLERGGCVLLRHPPGVDPEEDRRRPPSALPLDVEQGSVPAEHCARECVPELFGGTVTDASGPQDALEGP